MSESSSSTAILKYFFKPHLFRVILLLAASILVGGLEAITVALVYPILETAFEGSIKNNFVLSIFSNAASIFSIDDKFISYCLLFIIITIITFIAKIIFIRYRVAFAGYLVKNIQKSVYSKYLQADYQFFTSQKQGTLVYNAITAPRSLHEFLNSVTEIITQVFMSISVFVLLFTLSWQGTLVVFFMGFMYYLFTRRLARRIAYEAGRQQAAASQRSSIALNESINGIKQIKVFNTESSWKQRFHESINTYWQYYIRQSVWQNSLQPALIMLLYASVGIMALSIRLTAPDSFSTLIPVFGTFALAVFRLIPMVGGLGRAFMQVKNTLPNCEIVRNILTDKITTIKDGTRKLEAFSKSIVFDNISFSYMPDNHVLTNVDLSIEKGKTTAIVGRSGSGKTTVLNLLLRLYDVNKGVIKIDGIDIREIAKASWLEKIGYVSQDTFVFNDTVRNNIAFGQEYEIEDIVTAAKLADAHSFISQLPEGYDTIVGDRGMRLSGGQQQRIALARAMIRKPDILIFDEATNALDTITEAAVQNAIEKIAENYTVIIIAHRLSTIAFADQIIVLGNGAVIEEGTHDKLLENKGVYWNLYQKQEPANV